MSVITIRLYIDIKHELNKKRKTKENLSLSQKY